MQHGRKKKQNTEERTTTGLGVYCQLQQNLHGTIIFIQASATKIPTLLQAEAWALILSAKVSNMLQLQQVTLRTDNMSLGRAAAD
jgi:hypothetical protein